MVYEFPELQGLMGSYYARKAGLSDAVADAAKDHYAPLGPSDDVPTAPVSIAVALAEKIDKLTGFWAIDEKPTGSKDPFALRRAALGVIRILVENDLSIKLLSALRQSYEGLLISLLDVKKAYILDGEDKDEEFWSLGSEVMLNDGQLVQRNYDEIVRAIGKGEISLSNSLEGNNIRAVPAAKASEDLLSFIHDRLKVYLRDQGIRHDVIDACIAMDGSDDLTLLVKRARALSETLKTDDGENLIQGFKRANNILSQAEEADGVEYSFGADPKFAETEAEKDLFAALDKAEAKITPAMAAQDFSTAMAAMAELRGPIDAFFEAVQVNAENPTVRRNRLNLLSRIRTICSAVADLTKLDG